MKYEPVVTGSAIVGLVMAFVTFAMTMGWLDWSPEQMSAFEAFVAALGALVIPLVGGFVVRKFTISDAWAKEKGWMKDSE